MNNVTKNFIAPSSISYNYSFDSFYYSFKDIH